MEQNISIAIVSKEDDKLVAGIIMAVADKNFKITPELKETRAWYRFVDFLESGYNVFRHFQAEEAVDLAYLCTHRDFRGKGLASNVMKAAVYFLKSLNINGLVLHGCATSKQSKRTFDKSGFKEVWEVMLADYTDNGETVFQHAIEEPSVKYYTQICP